MTPEDADPSVWCPEQLASVLIASCLGAEARRTDSGRIQSTHDYDIMRADGTVVAFEVTQHAKSQHMAFRSEVSKRSWKSQHLSYDWVVDIGVETQLDGLVGKLVHCLGTAESRDIRALTIPLRVRDRERHAHAGLVGDLHVLGVRMVVRGGHASAAGAIQLNDVHSPTGYDANSIAEVVREHAIKRSDNLRKLARATCVAERHLFVWVHYDDVGATAALLDGAFPTELPELPPGIDAVWVALACDGRVVWRYDGNGWHDWSHVRTRVAQ